LKSPDQLQVDLMLEAMCKQRLNGAVDSLETLQCGYQQLVQQCQTTNMELGDGEIKLKRVSDDLEALDTDRLETCDSKHAINWWHFMSPMGAADPYVLTAKYKPEGLKPSVIKEEYYSNGSYDDGQILWAASSEESKWSVTCKSPGFCRYSYDLKLSVTSKAKNADRIATLKIEQGKLQAAVEIRKKKQG